MVDSGRKMEECFEKVAANFKKYSWARIPNASKNLEGGNVGLNSKF